MSSKVSQAIRKVFLLPVLAYQKLVSPFLGKNCIYCPTCSQYFKEAVLKHGIFKGCLLGGSRILRCSSLYLGGLDPVPEKFSFKYIKDSRTIFRRPKAK
jgi:uncharacterized protein